MAAGATCVRTAQTVDRRLAMMARICVDVFYGSDGPDGFFRFLSLKCEHRSRVHQISSRCSFIPPLPSLLKKRISCPTCPAGFSGSAASRPRPPERFASAPRAAGPAPVDIRQRTSSEVVCRAGTPQLCQQRPTVCDDVLAVGEPKATLVSSYRTRASRIGSGGTMAIRRNVECRGSTTSPWLRRM
jgi:hypothetical protein